MEKAGGIKAFQILHFCSTCLIIIYFAGPIGICVGLFALVWMGGLG